VSTVELVLDARAELGEGPIWDADRHRLLFVDIMRGEVHAFDPDSGTQRVLQLGRTVGAVACTVRGDWVVAAGLGFARVAPDTGAVTSIAEVSDRTDLRMNDGYVDPAGRFWAGTLSLARKSGQGALYRLDPDGTVRTMLAPVTTSNGIDWSPDGRLMYFADTGTRRVDVFDFEPLRGQITGRRPFVDFAEDAGRPDGVVVDAEGGVWVGLWRGWGVRRYRPDGRLDATIDVPAALVTKCAFGGPRLDELYITTASIDLTPDERRAQPLAGGLFRASPGVRGQAPRRFAG
jgi:sugar lactone lactonase YvrE